MSMKEEFAFMRYCFERRKDTRFVKNVYKMVDDFSLVNLERMGEDPTQKVIYYIAPDASGSGFFADHNRLLCYLYYADYFGMIPVVKYDSKYSYAEKMSVNGTENPFEYYFQQPGGISLEQLEKAQMVIKSRKENAALAGKLNLTGNGYDFSEKYISELGRISSKYVRLNEIVSDWMQEQIQSVLGKRRMLGVHVRGTDFKRNYKGHPIKITTEEYLKTALEIKETGKYERIFLATDDAEAKEVFCQALGSEVYFYEDVIRSRGDETVMKSENARCNHHYYLGLEVLRDAWTLGKCDGLVAGISQVSLGARILKKSFGDSYQTLTIIDKGMNVR